MAEPAALRRLSRDNFGTAPGGWSTFMPLQRGSNGFLYGTYDDAIDSVECRVT